jgi:hypothetical protein
VVVVLAGQVLGQLEVAVLVGCDDPPHHPGIDELGQVAVGGALRELGSVGEDVGQRHPGAPRASTSTTARRDRV